MTAADILRPSNPQSAIRNPQFPPAPERAPHLETLADLLARAQRAGIPVRPAQFEPQLTPVQQLLKDAATRLQQLARQ